jgi:hypothetical protein
MMRYIAPLLITQLLVWDAKLTCNYLNNFNCRLDPVRVILRELLVIGFRLSVMRVNGLPMTLLTGTAICLALRYYSFETQFTYSLVHYSNSLQHFLPLTQPFLLQQGVVWTYMAWLLSICLHQVWQCIFSYRSVSSLPWLPWYVTFI